MGKRFLPFLFFVVAVCLSKPVRAQETDRVHGIRQRLDSLSIKAPGLNQKVQLMVSGVSIKGYLNALAKASNLNMSVDPALNVVVYDTFNNATAADILALLAQKFNLDISVVGTIIYITPFQDPNRFVRPRLKDINAKYNQTTNTLSLELQNDSLPAVAKKISQVSGKNVIIPGALQNKLVTAFIVGAPFDAVLEKLAFTNELKMIKTGDSFYLFQPLAESEELYVNGDRNTSVRKNFRPAGPVSGGGATGIYVRMVNGQKLISVDAVNAPIGEMVKQASQESGKNYSIYAEIKGSITLHVTDVDYETFLNLLFKSTEYTFHSEHGIYIIGERKQEGLRSVRTIQLQNRAIDTVIMMIPTEWKRNVELKEFREQNTILISGSDAQINEVASLIRQLDVLVPAILVEVTMIDIRKSRTVSTGISAGISDSVKTGGTVLPGIDYTFGAKSINSFLSKIGTSTFNLGRVTPNFYLSIKALEESNNVDVRSVPKLVTLNGHSAVMSIGNKRYYKNTTQNVITTTATQSIFSNVFTPVDASLVIGIKPVVSGNDEVTLGISVNISDFTAIPTDGSPPPQAISKFETILRAHSEDTIILGGIERNENDESGSGVPILSRIPVLKWLFSSRTKTKSKVVSVLFIKTTIIR